MLWDVPNLLLEEPEKRDNRSVPRCLGPYIVYCRCLTRDSISGCNHVVECLSPCYSTPIYSIKSKWIMTDGLGLEPSGNDDLLRKGSDRNTSMPQ